MYFVFTSQLPVFINFEHHTFAILRFIKLLLSVCVSISNCNENFDFLLYDCFPASDVFPQCVCINVCHFNHSSVRKILEVLMKFELPTCNMC